MQKVRSEVADALHDGIEDLRDTASGYMEQGRDRVMGLEESFEDTVQRRPLTSVFAAVGLGFLVGLFFSRR
jgi:ElaB/YqjD/DUF883 family membrane-anchored ribosome-binding protein